MKVFLKRIFVPTLLLAWTIYYFVEVLGKDAKTGVLIKPISIIVFVLYVIIMIGEVKRYIKLKKESGEPVFSEEDKKSLINLFVCLGITGAYVLVMPFIGFVIATSAYLTGMYMYAKAGKAYIVVACSIVIAVIMFLIFSKVLDVPLPVNPWGF